MLTKLEQLIKQLCPDGADYKALGEIATIKTGNKPKEILDTPTDIEYINAGTSNSGYTVASNCEGDTVTTPSRGQGGIGYVGYQKNAFWLGPLCYKIRSKNERVLDNKFIYYYLSCHNNQILQCKNEGGTPSVNSSDLSRIKIPVPPLEVQAEIVRILDKFTELATELTTELATELANRKKQYEYYRDELLSSNTDNMKYKLSELFETRNGYTPSKSNNSFWNGNTCIPWFRMEDIRESGRLLDDSTQHVTPEAVKGNLFQANSIIISTSATIGEHALITVPSLANQRFTYLMLKPKYKEIIDIRYIFYYCFKLGEYCRNHLNQGNFASVDMVSFGQFEFLIPSIDRQKQIVSFLDRFDKLCNDITEGLPAEIEARQKQYEYYRDLLLSFNKKRRE